MGCTEDPVQGVVEGGQAGRVWCWGNFRCDWCGAVLRG